MKRLKKILVGLDLSWDDCFVADELSGPNAEAVRQALWLARYPEFDYMFTESASAERKQAYRDEAEKHIQSQIAVADLRVPARVHFAIESPDLAIMNCVEQHAIDLIVMGTVGRTGISGFITGNTAERLLPRIPCSLLAVKPPGFESPISPG